jgi:CHAT domain-containing protein/tetratricopeptide (TPR) repeat protein
LKFLNTVLVVLVFASSFAFSQAGKAPQASLAQKDQGVKPGVIVEEVDEGSGPEQAGLQKGDLILSWWRGEAGGKIESPFDWARVEWEQFFFEDITLRGRRGIQAASWDIGSKGLRGLSTRPNLSRSLLRFYAGCIRSRDKARCLQAAAQQPASRGQWLAWAWFLTRAAELQGKASSPGKGGQIYERILRKRNRLDPPVVAQVLAARASFSSRQHDELIKTREYFYQALVEFERLGQDNVSTINILYVLSIFSRYLNDDLKAQEYSREAFAIAGRLGNRVLAFLLFLEGGAALTRGDSTAAEQYYKQALAIEENRRSVLSGAIGGEMGLVAWRRGNLSTAEEYLNSALQILREKSADGDAIARCYQLLGTVVRDRGNLAQAQEYQHRALALFQKNRFLMDAASVFNDLAYVALYQGDAEKAEQLYRRALADQQQIRKNVLQANTLMGLGMSLAQQKKFAAAEDSLQQGLAIQHQLAPTSIDIPRSLNALGDIARERGDLGKAERYYREAMAALQGPAPESVFMVQTLSRLARVEKLRGAPGEAEALYRQALTMNDKLAPGSSQEAELLEGIAEVKHAQGQTADAAAYYERALGAFENQTAMLGGSAEVATGFRAKHQDFYRQYAGLLTQLGKPEAAFAVWERSRARTLLEMLAGSQVDVSKGADAGLLAKEKSLKRRLREKSERHIRLLGGKHAEEEIKAVEKEISDLTAEYNETEAQIRATSPAYAALTQPQSLPAQEIQQQLLDQDTLLLEYSLGEDRSQVFAVMPDSLQAFELPKRAGIEGLARRVYQLLIERNRSVKGESEAQREQRWAKAEREYDALAAELSRMVLGPVAAQIRGKRLVIVADGALHYIPFAALPEPGVAESQPLAVNHEVVSLPSASVLALIRQERKDRKPAAKAVAVLADPVFDRQDPRVGGGSSARSMPVAMARGVRSKTPLDDLLSVPTSAGMLTRSAADLGLQRGGQLMLPRLRFTRQEASAIYEATPFGQGMKAVDFQASRATAISPELANYRIVHFATHGLLNSQHPELSGLVFSLVDKNGKPQEGFLTLQDIYNLNLPAELVVLSACETGLGKEISGEGLIGLTRGFMYAGASRVVASLWKVSDVATAELMAEFYRSMEKDGLAPAAALRAAQVTMWKQKRWKAPYYWAAFQIQGEWR